MTQRHPKYYSIFGVAREAVSKPREFAYDELSVVQLRWLFCMKAARAKSFMINHDTIQIGIVELTAQWKITP